MDFKEIIENEQVLKVINEEGFTNPTEIQSRIIPFIKEGFDVIGQSKTGTGKTLAFAAPILDTINDNGRIQVVILAPTRELAIQIDSDFKKFSKYTNIKSCVVYGSSRIDAQIKEIRTGVEVIIGTPGRVMDLVKRHVVKVKNLKFFILDEADEMLSMGFKEELETIFNETNDDKQVLLFSATMPDAMIKLTKEYMKDNKKIVMIENDSITADNIKQLYVKVDDRTRLEAACRLLDFMNPKRCMIFCRTKKNADELLEKLNGRGYSVDVIHGDIAQNERIRTLDRFKKDKFRFLIATDVAARGIHVDDIELVLNYTLPESNESYVHRIGRTGRADKSGTSITLVRERDFNIIRSLEKHIGKKLLEFKVPEVSDILDARKNSVIDEVDKLKKEEINPDFNDYLDSLGIDELKKIVGTILKSKLSTNLGIDKNADMSIANKRKKRNIDTSSSTRIFLTIGKLDKIEKRELLNFIEKTAFVKEGSCFNVEIMPKFTFMNVDNKDVDKVIDNINNTRLKGRLIKAEKAKK